MKRFLSALLLLGTAGAMSAQSLRGSQSSVQKMYTRAVLNDLEFFRTSTGNILSAEEAVEYGLIGSITSR